VFVVLGLNTGHSNEDRCVTATQRIIVLVERQRGPVAFVTGVLVDVQCCFHAVIINQQVTDVETQNTIR
jgi:hypothetical protein